ncbi:MAG: hypothetical protein QW568_01805 [Candidatus Anstonellaceae archaeon]
MGRLVLPKRYVQVSFSGDRLTPNAREFKYSTYCVDITAERRNIGERNPTHIDGRIILVKKLPEFLTNMVVGGCFVQEVGFIQYRTSRDVATTILYYPKGDMENYPQEYLNGSRGFGYYAEWLAAGHMQRMGARYMATPADESSDLRIAQLEAAGLPIGYGVKTEEWRKRLFAGFKRAEAKWMEQHPLVETQEA